MKSLITDSLLRPQLAPSDAPNSNLRPLTPPPPPSPTNLKLLPKSRVPPRPKPPIPSEFFVYPKRSWRSMTKEQVRMHILDRYGARQRYIAAYKEWEEKHSKWAFGIYHLVRAVTKPQRREMQAEVEYARDPSAEDAQEAGVSTTTVTDVIGDLDVDFETALTALQDGAEIDELDRVRRWWIQVTRHHRSEKKNVCISTPLLPILDRQGNGSFGSRGSDSQGRHGTPDVDLPHQAARKIHSSMSSCVPPKLLPGQEQSFMSESEEDDDEEEEEKGSCPSWRIYSDQCTCGYAGCHCRSWMRWWNKTFQMLKYVEYVDIPVSTSGVSGMPGPTDGLLGGPPTRYTRVTVGGRYDLVEREPTVRSLRKPKSPKSKKRAWSFKELIKHQKNFTPLYYTRLAIEQQGHRVHEDAGTLGVQSSPKHIFKMHLTDLEPNPKIPAEYIQASIPAISRTTSICIPKSVVADPQWPLRNRALQCVAYNQYTYRLPSEIFFSAINLLDRYAGRHTWPAHLNGAQWDLVGFACLWLAWKYEDHTSVPPLDDLIAHSEQPRRNRVEVIFAEWVVRNTIGLDLSYTSPLTLMRLGLSACQCTRETKYVARFLADVSATVRHLARCPPSKIGPAAAWLAFILTDASLPDHAHTYINRDKAANYETAAYLIMGVLNMPRPIEKPREQALFYKWTLPIVNDIAGWCQRTLDSVWPHRTNDGSLPYFGERLLELRAVARSQPFELGPGPSPGHTLFEE
ncbi:unnamed protein product [Rhizoctonia solani]|uniref:Cyclin N-terminal domain-containing protein n=1 Tax=Rhizoctonia solani TaxID=456999 RepID=A0A8H3BFP6_9AGAM|nr:unnamed protein product [Rhizoctonia solani]